jgi:hypothetical protein
MHRAGTQPNTAKKQYERGLFCSPKLLSIVAHEYSWAHAGSERNSAGLHACLRIWIQHLHNVLTDTLTCFEVPSDGSSMD